MRGCDNDNDVHCSSFANATWLTRERGADYGYWQFQFSCYERCWFLPQMFQSWQIPRQLVLKTILECPVVVLLDSLFLRPDFSGLVVIFSLDPVVKAISFTFYIKIVINLISISIQVLNVLGLFKNDHVVVFVSSWFFGYG